MRLVVRVLESNRHNTRTFGERFLVPLVRSIDRQCIGSPLVKEIIR